MTGPCHKDREVLHDHPDRPEVVRKIVVRKVTVGNGEVALDAPPGSPGVSYYEALRGVIIADGEDGMTAQHLFSSGGIRYDAGLCYAR